MAYVSGYKHDIFVSYARVNDQPVLDAKTGWVTTFVKTLQNFLAQKLGRPDSFSLWMDPQLAGNVAITPEIMQELRESAILLMFWSPGYLASYWCQKEQNHFLTLVRNCPNSRIFLVELDALELTERPEELRDILGYRFWVSDRQEKSERVLDPTRDSDRDRYLDMLNALVTDLTAQLQTMRTQDTPNQSSDVQTTMATLAEPKATVFLANVTDDLYFIRQDVKQYLQQANLKVLPDTAYSLEGQAFQQAMRHDLAQSDVFVQLLSAVTGPKPPDVPRGFVCCRYELAVEAQIPILQWRPPDLDLTTVQDIDIKTLLEGETVFEEDIEDFKPRIEEATVPPTRPHLGVQTPLVFINRETVDASLAARIAELIEKFNLGYAFPLQSLEPSENREAFEQFVLDCDGLIIVYGNCTIKWVNDQFWAIRKIAWQRKQPFVAYAVYDGPPPDKPPINFKFPGMHILDCRNCLDERKLQTFIELLPEGATA